MQLKKWLDNQGIKNSFDTWHGRCEYYKSRLIYIYMYRYMYTLTFDMLTVYHHLHDYIIISYLHACIIISTLYTWWWELFHLLHTVHVGTKGAKKVLEKVAKGAIKNEGKVWFHELSDKGNFVHVMMQIMICYPFNYLTHTGQYMSE